MLSERSPGRERESKDPYKRDEVSVAIGVLRLVASLLAQDDTSYLDFDFVR